MSDETQDLRIAEVIFKAMLKEQWKDSTLQKLFIEKFLEIYCHTKGLLKTEANGMDWGSAVNIRIAFALSDLKEAQEALADSNKPRAVSKTSSSLAIFLCCIDYGIPQMRDNDVKRWGKYIVAQAGRFAQRYKKWTGEKAIPELKRRIQRSAKKHQEKLGENQRRLLAEIEAALEA